MYNIGTQNKFITFITFIYLFIKMFCIIRDYIQQKFCIIITNMILHKMCILNYYIEIENILYLEVYIQSIPLTINTFLLLQKKIYNRIIV